MKYPKHNNWTVKCKKASSLILPIARPIQIPKWTPWEQQWKACHPHIIKTRLSLVEGLDQTSHASLVSAKWLITAELNAGKHQRLSIYNSDWTMDSKSTPPPTKKKNHPSQINEKKMKKARNKSYRITKIPTRERDAQITPPNVH